MVSPLASCRSTVDRDNASVPIRLAMAVNTSCMVIEYKISEGGVSIMEYRWDTTSSWVIVFTSFRVGRILDTKKPHRLEPMGREKQ